MADFYTLTQYKKDNAEYKVMRKTKYSYLGVAVAPTSSDFFLHSSK